MIVIKGTNLDSLSHSFICSVRVNVVYTCISLPPSSWTKIAVTLSGNVVVVHVNCKEVARRVVALPDYCINTDNLVASVGEGMSPTEFEMMGLTVSARGRECGCTKQMRERTLS